MVGTPIEVNHRTVARINIDGPRIHVIVDAKGPPLEFIKIKLPNGKVITQKIKFDFYLLYCSHCRRMGHSTAVCRLAGRTNPSPSARTRGDFNAGMDKDGWQVVCRKGGRNECGAMGGIARASGAGRNGSRPPQTPENIRARRASRPPPRTRKAKAGQGACRDHVTRTCTAIPVIAMPSARKHHKQRHMRRTARWLPHGGRYRGRYVMFIHIFPPPHQVPISCTTTLTL